MSSIGSLDAQKGMVTALRAASGVTSLVQGVYDFVPQGTATPYVVVGKFEESDASSFGETGHEVIATINVWTRDGETKAGTTGAAGYRVGESIADAIVAALEDGFTADDHTVCMIDPRHSLETDQPDLEDPSLRLVSLKMKMLLEDTDGDTVVILDGGVVS